jgi:hypothetical protein
MQTSQFNKEWGKYGVFGVKGFNVLMMGELK